MTNVITELIKRLTASLLRQNFILTFSLKACFGIYRSFSLPRALTKLQRGGGRNVILIGISYHYKD